ncbi:MAG: hypothetical protein HQL40_07875 [Alphaproteobacteria bacterium]|nr:hypothetical protein [Alphaproteobacteria bacterium]
MLVKWLVLIAIVLIVWFGYRHFQRVVELGRRRDPAAPAPRADGSAARVEETVRCDRCGAFVPAREPGRCGRPDCPFLGRPTP